MIVFSALCRKYLHQEWRTSSQPVPTWPFWESHDPPNIMHPFEEAVWICALQCAFKPPFCGSLKEEHKGSLKALCKHSCEQCGLFTKDCLKVLPIWYSEGSITWYHYKVRWLTSGWPHLLGKFGQNRFPTTAPYSGDGMQWQEGSISLVRKPPTKLLSLFTSTPVNKPR